MPYRKEGFVNGNFYHVIFRGFNQKPLFIEPRDFLRFLTSAYFINHLPSNIEFKLGRLDNAEMVKILNGEKNPFLNLSQNKKSLVKIVTFSMLKNHVHFLLEQITSGGIQKFAQRLQNSFAKFLNIKYERRGPVFEKNFKAVPIVDNRQFRYVVGYIALNTLDQAGIEWRRVTLREPWVKVKRVIESYPWSSYHYFTGNGNFSALIDGGLVKKLFPTPRKFEKHLRSWGEEDATH